MRGAVGWTLAVLVVAAPAASAQPPGHVLYCSRECLPEQVNDDDPLNTPVNVVLYAHIFDVLQRAPLNAVPPDPGREGDVNSGFLTPTLKVREDLVYLDNNWFTMFHLPRFLSFTDNSANQDGPLAYPLRLSNASPAKVYWYLSPHAVPQGNSTASPVGSVGAMPTLTVYARMETGRHPGYGKLIAEGETSTAAIVGVPGSDYAYEFEVPLTIRMPVVPPEEGFVVSINWYQYENGEEQFSQGDWRIRSGPRFAPRVILPVENPMEVTEVTTVYRTGTHYIITGLSPVFGAYDIDPFSLNMTFKKGPTAIGNPAPLFYFFNDHKPTTVRVVWSVPGQPRDFRAGTYEFEVKVSNLWHTYEHRDTVEMDIIEFASSPKNAAGFEPLLLLLAGAVVATRVRRNN